VFDAYKVRELDMKIGRPTALGVFLAILVPAPALAKVAFGPAEFRDVQPLVGLSYSGAFGLSGSVGLLPGTRSRCTGSIVGPFAQAEVGVGGGRLSGGFALGASAEFPFAAAFGAKAFVMRSWSPSSTLPEHQTYLGAGVDVMLLYARVGIAGYQRVSGHLGERRGVMLSIGVGF